MDLVRISKIKAHLKSIKRTFRNGLPADPASLTGTDCSDTLKDGFWMEDLGHILPGYEHFQKGKLMQTPGPDRSVEMPELPVHLEILEPNSETSTNSVDERMEPPQTGGRSAGSIPATAPGAEVRKRKAYRAK